MSNEKMQYKYFKKITFLCKKGYISVLAIFVPVFELVNFVVLLIVYICYAPFKNNNPHLKLCLNYYL